MEKIDLPLSQFTMEQKLILMEELWNDITKNVNEFESPKWHEEILNDRKHAFQDGKLKISDWDEAKKRIRKNVSCE